MRRAASSLCLLALGACLPGRVLGANCVVSEAHIPLRSLGFSPALDVSGLSLPVTVDEAAGTIAIDFSSFGTRGFNIQGVDNDVSFPGEKVFTGTIDAGGDVTVPVTAQFSTTFTTPPTPVPIAPRLSTGIAASMLPGAEYPSEGVPLDFATGTMTLDGQSIIPVAPGLNISVTTGLRITCTLDAIPDRTKLPKAATLKSASGAARFGKPGASPPDGDRVTKLVATVLRGAAPLDPTAEDLFVALRGADGSDAMLVHVPAGTLAPKGKTLRATDTDGTTIVLVTGQKSDAGQTASVSGKIAVKRTKKGLAVTLVEDGLDLSKLARGPGSVAVAVGDQVATRPIKIKRTAKGLSFR